LACDQALIFLNNVNNLSTVGLVKVLKHHFHEPKPQKTELFEVIWRLRVQTLCILDKYIGEQVNAYLTGLVDAFVVTALNWKLKLEDEVEEKVLVVGRRETAGIARNEVEHRLRVQV
jgi:hypothetical protein